MKQAQAKFKPDYLPVMEACIIGAVAGISALLLEAGIRWLGSLRILISQTEPALEVLPVFGLIGGFIAGTALLLAPETAGSGIPQVRASLNRMKMPLGIRTALLKLAGGAVAIGSGLFMGREGPTVQVGASVAAQLSRWMPTTIEHRQQLVAVGAGAGLAAAFSAPLAGVTFVLEELLQQFKPATISLAIIACFSASLIENLFGMQFHPHVLPYVIPATLQVQDVLFFVLLGIVCAVGGVIFNRGIFLSLNLYSAMELPKPAKVALAGLITGTMVACMPKALHDYAATPALINAGAINVSFIPVVFLCFFILTLVAYGSGAPGGLFAPSLALGSVLGHMVGIVEQYCFGSGSPELFSLIGMGAFFSAVARVPLTATIIIFEITGDFALIVPLMISCVIAQTVGDLLYKGGLYELLMVWSGLHLRNIETTQQPAAGVCAKDIMRNTFGAIKSGTNLNDAIAILGRLHRTSFPVVSGKKLVGVFAPNIQLRNNDHLEDTTVDKLMFKHPVSISICDSSEDMLLLFSRYKFEWLPVTTNEALVGIVFRQDLTDALFPASSPDELDTPPQVHEAC